MLRPQFDLLSINGNDLHPQPKSSQLILLMSLRHIKPIFTR